MSDLTLLVLWVLVLGGALAAASWAHRRGIGAHGIRDALHVGCGVWVLGWRAWDWPLLPLVMVSAAVIGASLIPILAGRHRGLDRLRQSVSQDDERWAGIVLYTIAYAVLTAIGLWVAPFPAAAALLALSFGDGLGGLVGRCFGRIRYRVFGKKKTVEGSIMVAVAAALGVAVASIWFETPIKAATIAGAGLIALAAEAIAPRSTDNLLLPAAVWGFLS